MKIIDTTNLQNEINIIENNINNAIPQSYIGQVLIFDYTNTTIPTEQRFDTVEKVKAYFGGNWEAFSPGRVLIGEGTSDQTFVAGATGGASNHTLTDQQIPAHTHSVNNFGSGSGGTYANYRFGYVYTQTINNLSPTPSTTYQSGTTGQSHNNLQPYTVVYMWKRIA